MNFHVNSSIRKTADAMMDPHMNKTTSCKPHLASVHITLFMFFFICSFIMVIMIYIHQ